MEPTFQRFLLTRRNLMIPDDHDMLNNFDHAKVCVCVWCAFFFVLMHGSCVRVAVQDVFVCVVCLFVLTHKCVFVCFV
jgi:hypothetical protein